MSVQRTLILAHRYLGIAVGLVVVLWCLSGFVMMYVQYPSVTKKLSLQGSSPIALDKCCNTENIGRLNLVDVHRFRIEMMAGDPVVRISGSNRQNPIINLTSGELFSSTSEQLARQVAEDFKKNIDLNGNIDQLNRVDKDQWTVTNFYNRHRPLYQFHLDDDAGTQFYISQSTGEVVQFSTVNQRFWSWVGPITHWLYPTFLRQHNSLWAQVVIGLTIASIFLTVFGVYIGFRQFFKRRGKADLYRGWMLWHHYIGLLFGLFVLMWVTSGLFSMNPWNMVEFSAGQKQGQALQGLPLSDRDVSQFINRLTPQNLPPNSVRLEGYSLRGKLFVLAYEKDGSYQRYDGETLQATTIGKEEWSQLINTLAPAQEIQNTEMIYEDDAYYYSHHNPRQFPVQRVILNNKDQTRFYLNSTSGELAAAYDQQQRVYRWIFNGLHRGDFSGVARSRPFWDIWMWVLLLGVSAGAVTGAYLGFKRLFR